VTTKGKNYNSIVFLTTLSVYLGLVLAGGAGVPQVMAQAALTRHFDIQTEAEIKDDLDKKPDGETALENYEAAVEDLYSLAKDFSAKHAQELRDGRYEFDCFVDIYPDKSKTLACGGGSGIMWSGFDPPLEKIHQTFARISEEREQVKVNLILTADEFSLKTSLKQISKEQAERYAGFYGARLSRVKLRKDGIPPQAVIYQNTSISFENNQVFIVTRLPRGSIDSLLATTENAN
jgi:hypothetical protein